jgi:ADP-ribose pyrophosphatase YjhB (NUDIX family)
MNQSVYQYCPHCAAPLEQREVYGRWRAVCPQCNFIHFRDPKVAVIALVTLDQRVLLIQRAIDPARGKWALPGGYMDAGELPVEALQRELYEEVALRVQVRKLLDTFPILTPDGRNLGLVLAYHAVPADGQATELICDTELCAAGWFLPGALPTDLAFESTQVLLNRWEAGEQF